MYICIRNLKMKNIMKQTIAIIGANGRMGSALSRRLAMAGHRILLAGRSRAGLRRVYNEITRITANADVGLLECQHEASWEADVIIPAVPYNAQAEVAGRIKDVVTGKIVVSIANPLNETYDGLLTQSGISAAEELAALLPYSRIVKAFNTIAASDLEAQSVKKPDCFVAGDDDDAVATVSALVADAGFLPFLAGKLVASRTLEAMTLLLISGRMKSGAAPAALQAMHEFQ
jgi:hypothetical protein